ncbi:hypothetical protein PAXINDRAFT_22208 [Paxillus involutus ATCC 200175]|uniref:Uncharacterized protein n=1 Tax=Paxillus involutus ATCC 200175 TaxID=664439 RepID=A0A0C9SSD3_PAXIN|nr:hypothetical protein PAXINDRAFT_22208 [Paxillus involutus ATCC 200175]
MSRKTWTSEAQKDFLMEELSQYLEIGGKDYGKHWPKLFQRWAEQWPERATALPNIPAEQPLTDEQANLLAAAVEKRQKWMRWHGGAGQNRAANNKTNRIVDDLMEPKVRLKKPWEIYAKTYYQSRVKPGVAAGSNIVTVRQKIEDALKNESPEVLEEIECIRAEQKAALGGKNKKKGKQLDGLDDAAVETDPIILRTNIQQVGPTLQTILEHLARKTGWSFTVIMGGPDPIIPDDGNHITSLHVGRNKKGLDFSDAYRGFDTEVVNAYGEFLNNIYSKSINPWSMKKKND